MHNMLCGKLLGDGCLVKQLGRKPRFQFTHCKKDAGWSHHCYEELKESLPLNSPKYRRINDKRIASGFTESYFVQSQTSEDLCVLYKTWYPHSKKMLPFFYIEEYFDELSLAWWYQDDGHLKHHNGILKKIILSTDSFSAKENEFLISFLKAKYGLKFSLDRQNRLILYDQFQILYFLKLVDPYIHESMNRKKLSPTKPKSIAERTTIYLPADIILLKPTAEINNQYKKLPQLIVLAENHSDFFKEYVSIQQIATKPYQIKVHEEYKERLIKLKSETGLTISQLTAYCFRL